MKRLILITKSLLIVFIGISLQAQNSTNVNLGFEDKINNWLTERHVPAVGIGIIENSEIKYVKVFGELEKGVPAPDNTIFNVASITKTAVTMLTLKLVESGQWNLDEPLCNYWIDPDVANDPMHKKLTTRHVLTHQTGFVNWRWNHPTKKLTFDFEPGTKFQYSGEGFEYLRHALEHKFGKPIEQLTDSLLFKPLDMIDTRHSWDSNMDESRFAAWHDKQGEKYETSYKRDVCAADDLLTTVEDYCKFGVFVINGAGLSSTLFDDMVKPQSNIQGHPTAGLGWFIVKGLPGEEYAIWHNGSDMGVHTIAVLLPKSKRGIVVFTNGDGGFFVYQNIIKESVDVGETILDYMSGASTHKRITLSEETLKKYVGVYLSSYGKNLVITKEADVLQLSGEDVPTFKLYPETGNKFFIKEFDIQLEFINSDSLVIFGNGKIETTAKRIE
jgi:CubicO group peptidase (beta-lactamase class C family)